MAPTHAPFKPPPEKWKPLRKRWMRNLPWSWVRLIEWKKADQGRRWSTKNSVKRLKCFKPSQPRWAFTTRASQPWKNGVTNMFEEEPRHEPRDKLPKYLQRERKLRWPRKLALPSTRISGIHRWKPQWVDLESWEVFFILPSLWWGENWGCSGGVGWWCPDMVSMGRSVATHYKVEWPQGNGLVSLPTFGPRVSLRAMDIGKPRQWTIGAGSFS